MSLFFEREIQRAIKNADRSDEKNIMAQDPRRKKSWASENRSFSNDRNRTNTRRRDFDDWSSNW